MADVAQTEHADHPLALVDDRQPFTPEAKALYARIVELGPGYYACIRGNQCRGRREHCPACAEYLDSCPELSRP